MKIILFQPQIPQNTGNIVRTCSTAGAELVLVRPLGFAVTDRWLKRAGLDYWEGVTVDIIDDLMAYLEEAEKNGQDFWFLSSKVDKAYYEENLGNKDVMLIFGSETTGLGADGIFEARWPEKFLTIPMVEGARCLNLATSVGIVLFDAIRQQKTNN